MNKLLQALRYSSLTLAVLQAIATLQVVFSGRNKPTGDEINAAIAPAVSEFSAAFPALRLSPDLVLSDCRAIAMNYQRFAFGVDPGQVAYEAYRANTRGVSLASGALLPEWADLRPEIQDAWRASAKALVG